MPLPETVKEEAKPSIRDIKELGSIASSHGGTYYIPVDLDTMNAITAAPDQTTPS
jgi:hypothetical protein